MQIGSKGNIGKSRSRNNWMGYGINISEKPEVISIDVLPYLLWCNDYSSQNDAQHRIIIADDLASYNGTDLSLARSFGELKKEILAKIINYHNLDNIDILLWKDISQIGGYQELLRKLQSLTLNDSWLMQKLNKAVPRAYRDEYLSKDSALEKLGYVLEEVTVTLYLNENEYPIKIGHNLERSYDSRIMMIWNEYREELSINSGEPMMVYLKGGYTLNSTKEERIVPPYLVTNPSRRIHYKDDEVSIKEKLRKASKFYRRWCSEILEMCGISCSPDNTKNLKYLLYNELIKPMRACD